MIVSLEKHHALNSLDHSYKVQIQIKVSRLSPLLCPFQLSFCLLIEVKTLKLVDYKINFGCGL